MWVGGWARRVELTIVSVIVYPLTLKPRLPTRYVCSLSTPTTGEESFEPQTSNPINVLKVIKVDSLCWGDDTEHTGPVLVELLPNVRSEPESAGERLPHARIEVPSSQ
jgi:hypothetical protein